MNKARIAITVALAVLFHFTVMGDAAAAALFENQFPGVLADPNMKNGAMLKLGTFVKFPQAKEKGITKDKLEAFFAEANA